MSTLSRHRLSMHALCPAPPRRFIVRPGAQTPRPLPTVIGLALIVGCGGLNTETNVPEDATVPEDARAPDDAGTPSDSGPDAGFADAGSDGGGALDAGDTDAGTEDSGTMAPTDGGAKDAGPGPADPLPEFSWAAIQPSGPARGNTTGFGDGLVWSSGGRGATTCDGSGCAGPCSHGSTVRCCEVAVRARPSTLTPRSRRLAHGSSLVVPLSCWCRSRRHGGASRCWTVKAWCSVTAGWGWWRTHAGSGAALVAGARWSSMPATPMWSISPPSRSSASISGSVRTGWASLVCAATTKQLRCAADRSATA